MNRPNLLFIEINFVINCLDRASQENGIFSVKLTQITALNFLFVLFICCLYYNINICSTTTITPV